MEALRAAGRAVLRSPGLARHRLGVSRLRLRQPPPGSGRWAEMREPLLDGRGFALKYLGMTLVEAPRGEAMAAAAVRRIVAMARVGPKKFQKVILTVSSRGLSLQDAETKETIESISIYRISYCTTDKLQNKVFAYVAQNPQNGALECHAFLSPKKKIAQTVTLAVAQAFQVALDLWEAAQAGSRDEGRSPGAPGESTCLPARSPLGSPPFRTNFQEEEEEEEDEEEEDDHGDLHEAFAGWGGSPFQKLPSCSVPAGSSLGRQPPQQLPASRGTFLRLLLSPRPSLLISAGTRRTQRTVHPPTGPQPPL